MFVLCEARRAGDPEIAEAAVDAGGHGRVTPAARRKDFFDRAGASAPRRNGRPGVRVLDGEALGPEILNWWVSDGEVEALGALVGMYRRGNPGASVRWTGIRETNVAKARLRARMSSGAPPDMFQSNGGRDLLRLGFQARVSRRPPRVARRALRTRTMARLLQRRGARSRQQRRRSVRGAAQHPPHQHAVVRRRRAGSRRHRGSAHARRAARGRCHASPGRGPTRSRSASGLRRCSRCWRSSSSSSASLAPALLSRFLRRKGSPRAPEFRKRSPRLGRLLDIANADAPTLGWDPRRRSHAHRQRRDDAHGGLDEGVLRATRLPRRGGVRRRRGPRDGGCVRIHRRCVRDPARRPRR